MLKILARGIAALTVVAALVAAGPAVGGNPEPKYFSAKFKRGGEISFQLDTGRNPKVHDIYIAGMKADCDGDTGLLKFAISGSTPVLDDRSFAVRSVDESGRGKAIVRGKFSRRFKSVSGSARVYGRFVIDDQARKCDSGRQKYVAD